MYYIAKFGFQESLFLISSHRTVNLTELFCFQLQLLSTILDWDIITQTRRMEGLMTIQGQYIEKVLHSVSIQEEEVQRWVGVWDGVSLLWDAQKRVQDMSGVLPDALGGFIPMGFHLSKGFARGYWESAMRQGNALWLLPEGVEPASIQEVHCREGSSEEELPTPVLLGQLVVSFSSMVSLQEIGVVLCSDH